VGGQSNPDKQVKNRCMKLIMTMKDAVSVPAEKRRNGGEGVKEAVSKCLTMISDKSGPVINPVL